MSAPAKRFERKFRAGVLGATGMVGQRFVHMLANHPWFELADLAASERSSGKRYADVVKWHLDSPVPEVARDLVVKDLAPNLDCDFVFSALDSGVAGPAEEEFARAGYPVLSNSRNHRMDEDVPLLIPEVNAGHLDAIPVQQKNRAYDAGFIVTNPNCSTAGLVLVLKPLADAFGLEKIFVVTMQAVSGAGYPGVASLDATDNLIPFIGGEEEKIEAETLKLLGRFESDSIQDAAITVSAQCNRVNVSEGHTASIRVKLTQPASLDEMRATLASFAAEPQSLKLHSAPENPVIVRREPDRPQPRLDRNAGNGMSVTVGRIMPDKVFDYRFVALGHNTIRGAAGAAILNAELLVALGKL